MSLLRQRYLDVYPVKFTWPIRPPFWFWISLDGLPDTISDADLKARAMADYEEDKDALEVDASLTLRRREVIESLYIKAYTFTDDGESGTPCTIGLKDLTLASWGTMGLKGLTLDMGEEEIIARAIADYENDKSVIKKLNDYYKKRKDKEEE